MGLFPKIDKLWLVALTRDTSDAGSEDVLNVTINIDGKDVVDENFSQGRERGQGLLDEAEHTVNFDSAALTNTSIIRLPPKRNYPQQFLTARKSPAYAKGNPCNSDF